ncbi:MAG TPA: dioxygenase [Chloroflexota bacterium]|nr:dioxygenase [Chloroflexota bacterium]
MQAKLTSPPVPTARPLSESLTRRRLLQGSLLSLAFLGVGCSGATTNNLHSPTAAPSAASVPSPVATATTLGPTDASVDPGEATPAVTEGPYFKANSPERASLLGTGVVGTPLTLTGQVVSTRGQPIARALLDFWQADGQGSYDNSGYLLRGHQFTDAEGRYKLETVVPGLYPGRTRHIHVKVQAPNGPILTTQLFFPGEAGNTSDSIFNSKLLVAEQDGPNGTKLATFRFVVSAG